MLYLDHPQVLFAIIVEELFVLAEFLSAQSELFLFEPHLLVRWCQDLLLDLTRALKLVVDVLNRFFHRFLLQILQFFNALSLRFIFALLNLSLLLDLNHALFVELLNPLLGRNHLLYPHELLPLKLSLVRRHRLARVLYRRKRFVLKISYFLVQWSGLIPQLLLTQLSSSIRFR